VLAVDAAALVFFVDRDDVPACEEVEDVADFLSVLVDEGCAGLDYAGDVVVIGIYIAVEWLRLIFLVHDRDVVEWREEFEKGKSGKSERGTILARLFTSLLANESGDLSFDETHDGQSE
jgi:hypothetical protein